MYLDVVTKVPDLPGKIICRKVSDTTYVYYQLEPELFLKVTGLTVTNFELLCSLGVFNASLMDDAVYKFKRYEDSSLEYLD